MGANFQYYTPSNSVNATIPSTYHAYAPNAGPVMVSYPARPTHIVVNYIHVLRAAHLENIRIGYPTPTPLARRLLQCRVHPALELRKTRLRENALWCTMHSYSGTCTDT